MRIILKRLHTEQLWLSGANSPNMFIGFNEQTTKVIVRTKTVCEQLNDVSNYLLVLQTVHMDTFTFN